jgi:hypothetical protein
MQNRQKVLTQLILDQHEKKIGYNERKNHLALVKRGMWESVFALRLHAFLFLKGWGVVGVVEHVNCAAFSLIQE